MVASDLGTADGSDSVYILGCDGGFNSETNSGFACGFNIKEVLGNQDLAGSELDLSPPIDHLHDLTPGDTYTLEATVSTDGDLEVTLSDASGTVDSLTATVSAGITIETVGFLVGRDPSALTCADDFDFSSGE